MVCLLAMPGEREHRIPRNLPVTIPLGQLGLGSMHATASGTDDEGSLARGLSLSKCRAATISIDSTRYLDTEEDCSAGDRATIVHSSMGTGSRCNWR